MHWEHWDWHIDHKKFQYLIFKTKFQVSLYSRLMIPFSIFLAPIKYSDLVFLLFKEQLWNFWISFLQLSKVLRNSLITTTSQPQKGTIFLFYCFNFETAGERITKRNQINDLFYDLYDGGYQKSSFNKRCHRNKFYCTKWETIEHNVYKFRKTNLSSSLCVSKKHLPQHQHFGSQNHRWYVFFESLFVFV